MFSNKSMLKTCINKCRLATLLVGTFSVFCLSPASAIVIDIVPDIDPANSQDQVNISVDVSDLEDEVISAYDLDFGFDESIFNFEAFAFGNGLIISDQSLMVGTGNLNFAEVSVLLDDDLLDNQANAFTLATITFDVIGEGFSDFTLTSATANLLPLDIKGLGNEVIGLGATVNSSGLQIGQPSMAVPEPSVVMLLLAGGFGLFFAKSSRTFYRFRFRS